ncbi:uncharacterized protein [Musca autumnalis]|uniref:uncharacterized protein n=1 Tax=Musca autumnalis TaxID=221902 RepID=UPI003CF1BCBA
MEYGTRISHNKTTALIISSNTTTNVTQIDIDNPATTSAAATHATTTSASGTAGGVDDLAWCSTSFKALGSSSSSAAAWQARSVSDIKMSSIYKRSSTEAPAELYRKDLISAMKLPENQMFNIIGQANVAGSIIKCLIEVKNMMRY